MTDAPSSPDDHDPPDEDEPESDTPPEPGDPGTPTGTPAETWPFGPLPKGTAACVRASWTTSWRASPDLSKGRDTDLRRAGIAAPQGQRSGNQGSPVRR